MNMKYLSDINEGETAEVLEISTQDSMRRRLLDIGLIPETEVVCLNQGAKREISAYLIRGAVIALRKEDCKNILIKS